MRYILFFKDDIAMAKGCYKTTSNINTGAYDKYTEVTLREYNTIELPAKKVNERWVRSDYIPTISYPKTDNTELPVSETEQLRADISYLALMTGVEL